jgi:hypothetical protein
LVPCKALTAHNTYSQVLLCQAGMITAGMYYR